jgi:hypothetical protein
MVLIVGNREIVCWPWLSPEEMKRRERISNMSEIGIESDREADP